MHDTIYGLVYNITCKLRQTKDVCETIISLTRLHNPLLTLPSHTIHTPLYLSLTQLTTSYLAPEDGKREIMTFGGVDYSAEHTFTHLCLGKLSEL